MLVKSAAVPICPEQCWHRLPSLRPEHSQCQETKSSQLYHKALLALSHVSTWKTLAHSPHLGFSWKKPKIITCTAVSQMPLCIVTVSRMLKQHLLAQQEPFWQNCWTGHFGPTLSNPVLFQFPWKSAGCDTLLHHKETMETLNMSHTDWGYTVFSLMVHPKTVLLPFLLTFAVP